MGSRKKSAKWGCPHGCDVSTKICKHLEAKLPQVDAGKLSLHSKQEFVDVNTSHDTDLDSKYKLYESKLRGLGFKEYEIKLIMDRFISNLTIKEITERHGYLSTATVVRLLAQLKKNIEFLHKQKGSI